MARRPPRKVTYFEPVAPRLARNTVIESRFEVGRRFRCTMRINCSRLDPEEVVRPVPGEWHCQLNGPRAPCSGPARLERGSMIGKQRSSPTQAGAPPTPGAYHGRSS